MTEEEARDAMASHCEDLASEWVAFSNAMYDLPEWLVERNRGDLAAVKQSLDTILTSLVYDQPTQQERVR